MEETKGCCHEGTEGTCQHGAGQCGEMHRFCHKRCCFLKCIAIVIVLGVVFALGVGVGEHRGFRHGGYGEFYGGGSYHRQMMRGGGANWGDQSLSGRTGAMYRMMGLSAQGCAQAASATSASTSK